MSMSRARFNLLNRIGLLIVGCAILIFINIAAQPGHRRYGPYLARFNTPQAFISEWNQFAAFITVTHPVVVNFPKVWNLSDMVCIVASIQGGIGPTIVSDQDLSSQLNWDKDPTNALIFTVNDISFLGIGMPASPLLRSIAPTTFNGWGYFQSLFIQVRLRTDCSALTF